MNQMNPVQAAYVAGFLDGDGSIYVRLKPNATHKYGFQIAPTVAFFQSKKEISFLRQLQQVMGAGYIRSRNDGIAELTIGDISTMRNLVIQLEPYLLCKLQQAQLLVQILDRKKQVKSREDFLEVVRLIDQYKKLNYSKKRSIDFEYVQRFLRS